MHIVKYERRSFWIISMFSCELVIKYCSSYPHLQRDGGGGVAFGSMPLRKFRHINFVSYLFIGQI